MTQTRTGNVVTHMKKLERIKSASGFTLAETLLTVFILMLVGIVMATGIPAAKNAYEDVVVASNAQVLLSTAVSVLRNELGTAQDVEAANNEIIYYNSARSAYSKIYLENGDIMLQRYYSKSGDMVTAIPAEKLVSEAAAMGASAEKLHVSYTKVKYENGIVTFSSDKDQDPGITVNRDGETTSLASRDNLSIRVISN